MAEWWVLRFEEDVSSEEDGVGVAESQHELPFLFKVLLSADTRLLRRNDELGSERVVGLEGRTEAGLARAESYLGQLDVHELQPAIDRTVEQLRAKATGQPVTRVVYTPLLNEDDPQAEGYCTGLIEDIAQWEVEGERIARQAREAGQHEARIRDIIVELGLHNFAGAPPPADAPEPHANDDGLIPGRARKDHGHDETLRSFQSAVTAEAHHRSTRGSTSVESEDRNLEEILERRRVCKVAVLELGRSQVAERVSSDSALDEKAACFARVFDIGLAQELNVLSAFDIAIVAATETEAELAATETRIRSRMVDGDRSRMQEIYTKQVSFIELLLSEPSWHHHVEPPAAGPVAANN